MLAPADFFSDVPQLLSRSRPGVSRLRFWQAGLIFLSMVIVGGFLGREQQTLGPVVDVLSGMILLALFASFVAISTSTVRRVRQETVTVGAAEELVQLRYWPAAAALLRGLLNRPMRLPSNRNHALILLAGVLSRYGLFDSALQVQQALLEEQQLDLISEFTIRLARAATLLREDRLFDADRAIVELRRNLNRLRETHAADAPAATLTAGLALVELYRDVKTGHPAEAIETFDQKLPLLREELGHRVSEAYVLAAKAHDLLGHRDLAAEMYRNATALAPAVELHRRFPETASLARDYVATVMPSGVA